MIWKPTKLVLPEELRWLSSRIYLLYCVLLLALFRIQTGNGSTEEGAANAASNMRAIKLRIGLPKKTGFTQFIDVRWNHRENNYSVPGYCFDVFNAIVNALPFNVSLEFEPYINKLGQSAGTYDSLVQQVPKLVSSFSFFICPFNTIWFNTLYIFLGPRSCFYILMLSRLYL